MVKRIMSFKTGIDIADVRCSITLNSYTCEDSNTTEYVVQVYDTETRRLREKSFDNISAAKRRFLFEVENAAIFTNIE